MKHLFLGHVNVRFRTILINDLTLDIGPGWTGISGPNGCGKTTLARFIESKLSAGESMPGCSGSVSGPESCAYVSQFAHDWNGLEPGDIAEIIYDGDNRIRKLMSMLEIEDDWPYRQDELSFGERRRLQLAAVLARLPEVLILDEPENHLDAYTNKLISDALRDFEGIGVIIGHNRDIMNSLCTSTLLIQRGECKFYRTNLSGALSAFRSEQERILFKRAALKASIQAQKQALGRLNANEAKARKALSKRGLTDPDSKTAVDMARLTGADKSSGRKAGLQKKLIAGTEAELEELSANTGPKIGLSAKGIQLKRDFLIHLNEGGMRVNPGLELSIPELSLRPGDKVALYGPNGCGKTSFIRSIIEKELCENASRLQWEYVPQELSEADARQIFTGLELLTGNERGEIMAYFSRLGGDSQTQCGAGHASPGELRKLMLSRLFFNRTELLILDEPCNHMDVFSIEAIEDALKRYEGSLLFISHDLHFIKNVANTLWRIENGGLSVVALEDVANAEGNGPIEFGIVD